MRTRLVRVRRRGRTLWWAILFLIAAMALYVRVSLPMLRQLRDGADMQTVGHGERVTREISIDALSAYLISFGVYDSTPSAQIEAARYVSRGAAGYVLEGESRQVIGSGYEEEEEARQVCAMLREREGIAASVVSLSAPAVTMRMTAGSAQIEAFLDAEQTVRACAPALLQLSFSVDRGEASAYQAGQVIRTHRGKVDDALQTLRAQCAEQPNAFFNDLMLLMEDMLSQMDKMQKETGVMALSSRLKYFYIDARVRQIRWMNDISGT